MTTSPESHRSPEPFSPSAEQLAAANVDSIDEFRDYQHDAEAHEIISATSPSNQAERLRALQTSEKKTIDAYLEAKGIPAGDFRDALAARYAENSYYAISNADWHLGNFEVIGQDEEGNDIHEETTQSGRDAAQDSYETFARGYTVATPNAADAPTGYIDQPTLTNLDPTTVLNFKPNLDPPTVNINPNNGNTLDPPTIPDLQPVKSQGEIYREGLDTDPRFIKAQENFENARDELAKLAARRSGKLMSPKLRELQVALRANYNHSLVELKAFEFRAYELDNPVNPSDPDASAEQAQRFAVELALQAEFELTNATNEAIKETPLGKLCNSAAVQWMITGNTTTRIAKGVAVGALIGGAGALIAGAGAGAGVVAGIGMGAKLVKNFAVRDAKKGQALDTSDINDQAAHTHALNDHADYANTQAETMKSVLREKATTYEAAVRKEQSKRRRSAAFAMGTIAIGAAAADAIGHLSGVFGSADTPNYEDDPSLAPPGSLETNGPAPVTNVPLETDRGGTIYDVPKTPETGLGSGANSGASIGTTETSTGAGVDSSTDTGVDSSGASDVVGNSAHSGIGEIASNSGVASGVSPEVGANGLHIEKGDGWFKVMKDIVPVNQRADVLQASGRELTRAGYAYFDQARGEYGLKMPSSGVLSQRAIDILTSHVK